MILDNIARLLILSDCADTDVQLSSLFIHTQIKTDCLKSTDDLFKEIERLQPEAILLAYSFPNALSWRFLMSLREAAGDKYLPIIVVANNSDFNAQQDSEEGAYLKSIGAGANELIYFPCQPQFLIQKLNACIQLCQLQKNNLALQATVEQEEYLAEKLVCDHIDRRNFGLDKIGHLHIKAHEYRKDFYLCAQSPNGDLNVLLGHFSGFNSALTFIAIPLAEAFRTMTSKGFKLINIITQINQLLYELLPNDVCFFASVMNLSSQKKRLRLFNASAPDVLIFSKNSDVKHRCSSQYMPLGVLPQISVETQIEEVDVELSDRIIFYTEGLLTLLYSHKGYGSAKAQDALLLSLLQKGLRETSVKDVFLSYLNDESSHLHFDHDLTLIDLPCCDLEELLMLSDLPEESRTAFNHHESLEPDWKFNHRISGRNLNHINPIPLLLNVIKDSGGDDEHAQNIYTVLKELYDNALLHGVLKIKTHALYKSGVSISRLKSQLINKIETGFIDISIKYYDKGEQGAYVFRFTDSGEGFDFKNFFHLNSQLIEVGDAPLGRGIELVNQLCEYINYQDKGNSVEAVYLFNFAQ